MPIFVAFLNVEQMIQDTKIPNFNFITPKFLYLWLLSPIRSLRHVVTEVLRNEECRGGAHEALDKTVTEVSEGLCGIVVVGLPSRKVDDCKCFCFGSYRSQQEMGKDEGAAGEHARGADKPCNCSCLRSKNVKLNI